MTLNNKVFPGETGLEFYALVFCVRKQGQRDIYVTQVVEELLYLSNFLLDTVQQLLWLHAIKAFLKKFFFTHSNFLRKI